MSHALLRSAAEADEVAAGLQVFLDHIPQPETDIDECIRELIAISTAFRELDFEHPEYALISKRIASDVDLNIRSLRFTLRHVRDMFGETRHLKYSGERPYRRAWDELNYKLTGMERDFGLFSRLETYSIFIHNILGSLRGDRVEPGEIVRDRERISRLLKKQEPLEDHFVGMSFGEIPAWPAHRPPIHPFHNFPFAHHSMHRPTAPISAWSDESSPFVFPPAPEPPNTWESPASTSISSGSQQTWTSNSSGPLPPPNFTHWAVRVFDGRHPSTEFRTRGELTACYGRPEPPSCTERLAADHFIEVLRLPLDATRVYARLYWRPSDSRSRIMLSTKDPTGTVLRYCIPLTALKLVRNGPCLKLCRYNTEDSELTMWANLNFPIYEQLILFYCTFAALKSQDAKKFPDILADRFHKRDHSEEIEEFSGEIRDENYLHALRIYRDIDSGGIRLEARARRGNYTATPIWTAFITEFVDEPTWMKRITTKVVQLNELDPDIFCHGYTPPRGKSGKFRMQFTSSKDANAFVEMVKELAT